MVKNNVKKQFVSNWESNIKIAGPWLILLFILVVAGFFRLTNLDLAPPGFYPDEAMEGNNAIQALETGNFKVFYQENNGREGLFVNLVAVSIKIFGKHIWSIRIVSAIAGMLTVLGLYLVAKLLFNWQIAAFSSYLLAISFWHVNFSRIGFRAILAPLFLVWGLYFCWRGLLRGRRLDFIISGFFLGLGFYTYIPFRIMPLVLIVTIIAYLKSLKKDLSLEQYQHAKIQMIRGLLCLAVVMVLVALPIGYYFLKNPADFSSRIGQVSVFNSPHSSLRLIVNTLKTLEMFNVAGDNNWRHNFAGSPELLWPIGILFIVGFLRSCIQVFKEQTRNGYSPVVDMMLLSWFFIGLIPVILSGEGVPHALRSIIVIPPVMIFAGEALHWIFKKISNFYGTYLSKNINSKWLRQKSSVALMVVLVFLGVLTAAEYNKYFHQWAKNQNTAIWFSQSYVDLGNKLNAMPSSIKKYVLVNTPGVLINDIPWNAQTVMFVTDTYTLEKQQAKKLYYLTIENYCQGRYERHVPIFPLETGIDALSCTL